MYSVWRETYGDMISNMWRNASEPNGENISRDVLNDVENACKSCRQFHATMWRATCGDMMLKKWTVRCAVWREAYGDMMSSMRRMPCKPCGE